MTKNSNKGGPALKCDRHLVDKSAQWTCKLRGGNFTKTRDTGIMTKRNIGIAISPCGATDCFLVFQLVLVRMQFWGGGGGGRCAYQPKLSSKRTKIEVPENPGISKIEQTRQSLSDAKLYTRYRRTAKPVEEAMNARLASVSIVEWVIFLRTKRKERSSGETLTVVQPKLRVNRLRVIRIREVCESMRFDSGPEVSVRVNRNYVLTEYVLNENDCITQNLPIW